MLEAGPGRGHRRDDARDARQRDAGGAGHRQLLRRARDGSEGVGRSCTLSRHRAADAAYDTAMRSEGGSASADFQIGLHCDGYNLAAPCTSVVGSGCTGGWLNVSAAWNNRISSTLSGCPQIKHFDGFNLTGAGRSTVSGPGPHNLTTFNNLTRDPVLLSGRFGRRSVTFWPYQRMIY